MSRDLLIRCVQHETSSDDLGNVGSYLHKVREWISKRDKVLSAWNEATEIFELYTSDVAGIERQLLTFFMEHPKCDLEIKDEYGEDYDLSPDPLKCWAYLTFETEANDLLVFCEKDANNNHIDHESNGKDLYGFSNTFRWRQTKKTFLTTLLERNSTSASDFICDSCGYRYGGIPSRHCTNPKHIDFYNSVKVN